MRRLRLSYIDIARRPVVFVGHSAQWEASATEPMLAMQAA